MERTKHPLTKSKTSTKGMSKPPKWNEDLLDVVRYLASQGFTERQIADKFKCHVCTIEYWKRTKPEFLKAIQQGKDEIDEQIEQAFARIAKGYDYPDVQVFLYRGEPVIVPITRHIPPNAFAAFKWLTIRRRERWIDVQKVENNVNFNITQNLNLVEFTDTELLALEKLGVNNLMNGTRDN